MFLRHNWNTGDAISRMLSRQGQAAVFRKLPATTGHSSRGKQEEEEKKRKHRGHHSHYPISCTKGTCFAVLETFNRYRYWRGQPLLEDSNGAVGHCMGHLRNVVPMFSLFLHCTLGLRTDCSIERSCGQYYTNSQCTGHDSEMWNNNLVDIHSHSLLPHLTLRLTESLFPTAAFCYNGAHRKM